MSTLFKILPEQCLFSSRQNFRRSGVIAFLEHVLRSLKKIWSFFFSAQPFGVNVCPNAFLIMLACVTWKYSGNSTLLSFSNRSFSAFKHRSNSNLISLQAPIYFVTVFVAWHSLNCCMTFPQSGCGRSSGGCITQFSIQLFGHRFAIVATMHSTKPLINEWRYKHSCSMDKW